MKMEREVFLACAGSALVVLLFFAPVIFNIIADARKLTEFRNSSEGKLLPPDARILDLHRSVSPDGITVFCRFTVEQGSDIKLDCHGRLPPSAQAIIRDATASVHISRASLPMNTGHLDFAPNQVEPEGWLIVYDQEQRVGWIFISE